MRRPLLEMQLTLYKSLVADLLASGKGIRESGAFLLGSIDGTQRCVTSYLMYDVVAPNSAREHDYVAFTAAEMAVAWNYCYRTGTQVVADVHTHPTWPHQSITDRAHPIVSVEGHVALIVPFFALRNPQPEDLGVHVFLGARKWRSMFDKEASDSILLHEDQT